MNGQVVWEHFKELQGEFPNLTLTYENGSYYVRGEILFHAQYNEEEITNLSFLIELEIAPSYPNNPPVTRELGGRIPNSFHTFSDGTLCLGAPLAISMTFVKNPTLLGYVKEQLIPYFYSFIYKERNNELPYGELEHNSKGIMSYYKELLEVTSDEVVLRFLYLLAFQKYRGHQLCPCRSGSILRKCHGPFLLEIQKYQTTEDFQFEFRYCFEAVKQERSL